MVAEVEEEGRGWTSPSRNQFSPHSLCSPRKLCIQQVAVFLQFALEGGLEASLLFRDIQLSLSRWVFHYGL